MGIPVIFLIQKWHLNYSPVNFLILIKHINCVPQFPDEVETPKPKHKPIGFGGTCDNNEDCLSKRF